MTDHTLDGRTVLDARDISRALTRISHEILERNKGLDDLVLLGIPDPRRPPGQRIAERIAKVEGGRCRWARSTSPCTATTCASIRPAAPTTP
jgi:pyrimidine operon attenuation protein/uracil phosphoribosyltransferase